MSKKINLVDISNQFRVDENERCRPILDRIMAFEETPHAILIFDRYHQELSDYWFWFTLSSLWVSYSGFSDIELWKKHFNSDRPMKKHSIMKPSELKVYKKLTPLVKCYRAHRKNETDWIAYTLKKEKAIEFAESRCVNEIKEYRIPKKNIDALFLRRKEFEIICINKDDAKLIKTISLDNINDKWKRMKNENN